jgi:hypothetical protein
VEVWQCRICIRIRNSLEGNEDAPRVILASRVASPDLAVAVTVAVDVDVRVDVAGPDGLAAPRNTRSGVPRFGTVQSIRRSR